MLNYILNSDGAWNVQSVKRVKRKREIMETLSVEFVQEITQI
jgi:hypothetical protein